MRHALEFSTEGFVRVAVLTRGSLQCCCDACSVLSGAEALGGAAKVMDACFP